jgi:hypothetical protein
MADHQALEGKRTERLLAGPGRSVRDALLLSELL